MITLLWVDAGASLPLIPVAFQWFRPARQPVRCPYLGERHYGGHWTRCYTERKHITTNGRALAMAVIAAIGWPITLCWLIVALTVTKLPDWLGRIMPELPAEREWRGKYLPDLPDLRKQR